MGYSIRFEDVSSEATRIKFLTDGLLLREALVDPLLSRYSVIMVSFLGFHSLLTIKVDEAHERSLSSDVLLGLLKKIRKKRRDLRIIVSSATIQAEDFLDFFSRTENDEKEPQSSIAKIVSIEGRIFPVDIHYLEDPAENYVLQAVRTVFEIHTKEGDGDVLIFLTGRNEIEQAIELINEEAASKNIRDPGLQAVALYAGLPTEQQMLVFEPAEENTRKVIVATNIAEASVTIDGISFVIDCGFVKLRAYNPNTGIETLTTTPVSKASANQRAGRAEPDETRQVLSPLHRVVLRRHGRVRPAGNPALEPRAHDPADEGPRHRQYRALRLAGRRRPRSSSCARSRCCTPWKPSTTTPS